MQKAIQAYQTQMFYGSHKVVPKTVVTSNKSNVLPCAKKKKGFFSKILHLFHSITTPKKCESKVTISKPSVKEKTVYTKPKETSYIYNNFEKTLRDMRNYSRETPTYQVYKNGRQINFEPRYL